MKVRLTILTLFIFLLTLLGIDGNLHEDDLSKLIDSQVLSESEELYLVKKVIDGDTIELSSGDKVRYIGIDTPETLDPRKSVQCFGKEASDYNKKLVEGKFVRLEKDISEKDRYGRLLRYVFVKSDKGDEIFVNEILVKDGYAYASSFPPDVKYQEKFSSVQMTAEQNNLGLWSKCN